MAGGLMPARSTPWGITCYTKQLIRGCHYFETKKKSGLLLTKITAEKNLSKEALENSVFFQNAYFYEVPSKVYIPMLEMRVLVEKTFQYPLLQKSQTDMIRLLSSTSAEYLLTRGIQVDESAYEEWKYKKRIEVLRDSKSQNLIVERKSLNDELLFDYEKAFTADGGNHFIVKRNNIAKPELLDSYQVLYEDELPDIYERFEIWVQKNLDNNLTKSEILKVVKDFSLKAIMYSNIKKYDLISFIDKNLNRLMGINKMSALEIEDCIRLYI